MTNNKVIRAEGERNEIYYDWNVCGSGMVLSMGDEQSEEGFYKIFPNALAESTAFKAKHGKFCKRAK